MLVDFFADVLGSFSYPFFADIFSCGIAICLISTIISFLFACVSSLFGGRR